MKKYIVLSALVAVAFSSCVREELEPVNSSRKGISISFEGDFAASTKVSFGDASNGVHGLNWSKGDAIGVISYTQEETVNDNVRAVLHDDYAGKPNGIFKPMTTVYVITDEETKEVVEEGYTELQYPKESDEKFVVYYPYKKGTVVKEDACIHNEVAIDQFQNTLGDRLVCANGFASAIADVQAASNKATFSLRHHLAYIRVKAVSSEFSGYQLHSVKMYDKNQAAALAGKYSVKPTDGTMTIDSETVKPYVSVIVKNHDFNSSVAESEVYLAILPGDHSAADLEFVVSFVNEAGTSKTLPVTFAKTGNFPAGSLTTIDLGDITSAMNTAPWSEITEERDLLGKWAYGSQNTYYVQIPEGDARKQGEGRQLVTIDVKPRGDFSKVKEPKYYAILCPGNYGTYQTQLSLDGSMAAASINSAVNMTGYSATPKGKFMDVKADYTIEFYELAYTKYQSTEMLNTHDWATVGIFDAEKKLLWSYMICTYKSGDAPKDIQYPGFTMMDRFLGQGNGNEKALELGTIDCGNPAFFQWGRKDPLSKTTSAGLDITFGWSKDLVDDPGDAAALAGIFLVPDAAMVDQNNGYKYYKGEPRYDLWGGSNNTDDWYDPNAKGHKTVYDPCPEGYRVPDAYVFNVVTSGAEIWESPYSALDKERDNPLKTKEDGTALLDASALAYPVAGGYDLWPWLGHLGDQYNSGNGQDKWRPSEFLHIRLETWANSATGAAIQSGQSRGVTMEYGYWNSDFSKSQMNINHDARMSYAFPVRCQKED